LIAQSDVTNPEIGVRIVAGGIATNYHDTGGGGSPVVLLHGSGPGVSAWANWRLTIPGLSGRHRVIAPDQIGFGYTDPSPDGTYPLEAWVAHVMALLDELAIEQTHVVGNSFGAAVALRIAIDHPFRLGRLVLMGPVGVRFELTPGLDEAWGYSPSIENMRRLLDVFAVDRSLVTDDLARMRYEASLRTQAAFSAMFPAPRQRWIEALASSEDAIAGIEHKTLIIHGREDRVIPLSNSLRLLELIPASQLHVFGQSGHWVQIEQAAAFNRLVTDFLS
jgi:2-hydroxymuconate-semialdehyde hydrolase